MVKCKKDRLNNANRRVRFKQTDCDSDVIIDLSTHNKPDAFNESRDKATKTDVHLNNNLDRILDSRRTNNTPIKTQNLNDEAENNDSNKKKNEFQRKNIPHKPIFAFHGTNAAVIDNILKTNFDYKGRMVHGNAHGPGNYFSEYPSTALGYSNDRKHLIFCQILPRRQYKGGSHSWPNHDSKLVSPDSNDVSQMVIIQDKNQILPYCVINL